MLSSLLMWVKKLLPDFPVSTSRIFYFSRTRYIVKEGREGIPFTEPITLASGREARNIFAVRPQLSVK